jgi:hypothetical protein
VGKEPKGNLLKEINHVQFDFLILGAKVWIEREEVDGEFLLESSNLHECP